MKNTPLLLQLLDVSKFIDLKACQMAFQDIRQDPYIEAGFRHKEIARYRRENGAILRQTHGPLCQSSEQVPFHSGKVRSYPEFDVQDQIATEVHTLIHLFSDYCALSEGETILFQAQRVTTSKERLGLAVAEGWHQDGTDIMGLLCVDRMNITGGTSQVALQEGEDIFLNHTLQPGQMLIFDDRMFWHYATPIFPDEDSQPGYRDIFIISALGKAKFSSQKETSNLAMTK